MRLDIRDELVVDNFAGGGGASTGIERALGRPVDVAINHDPEAIAMHRINHPGTTHYCESVFKVDPIEITGNQPVGLAWFSPDCTHHSKAKGGAPRSPRVRGLAWVVIRWARRVKPRVIMLENVEEFQDWGPLLEDGKPCPQRRGKTFTLWLNQLRRFGYQVEHRELRACDYGAPTTRKRLFVIARRDGLPIVWPKPTHGPGLLPYRTAAECIDWTLPCPSIFERTRPLAENTLRRIARGVMKYVVNSASPFIVPLTHTGDARVHPIDEPVRTLTTANGGELALCAPTLVQVGYGERDGQAPRVPGLDKPLGTVVAGGGKHALVAAFLAKHYGGNETPGSSLGRGMDTITTQDHHALVAAHLAKFRGDSPGTAADSPVPTITAGPRENPAGAAHALGLVATTIAKLRGTNTGQPSDEPLQTISAGGTHFAEVRALLLKFYGTEQDPRLTEPMHTVTTKDRFGLVTVHGEPYAIVDIGMRMLQPRELYRAQGFPEDYVIEFEHNGRPLPKHAQVRMCGNSVCPPIATALIRANFAHEQKIREAA
jgi:DNA (cytosine-5)-methyltransferase 1